MDTTADDTGTASLPDRSVTDLARPGSRAVIVGTGTHAENSALRDISTVADTVTAVRDVLINQCAMDGRHVIDATDPESPSPFLSAINQAAEDAEDVLLLYYIGHGLVSLEGELFLATAATTDREVMLPTEALSFAAVRRVLSNSRARHVVVVLDCCFSGLPPGDFGAAAASAFELMNVRGSYLLSATSPTGQALAPERERYTAFSGALIEFLRDGAPTAPHDLTLDDAYGYLERALPAVGAPAPQRRAGGNADSLVVAVNPQAPEVIQPRSGHSERIIATLSSPRRCPYPGLGAFTAADARYFYGRERLVSEILGVLAAYGYRSPLAVVGRSGAGKSSLLQAGLLPAIRDGRLESAVPGARHWPQVVMTPGEHPMHVLARRLAAGTVPDGLILCVDQFEEVFTACGDEDERRAFIQSLTAAASRQGTPRVQVILGLRADFYGRCLDYPELAPMVTAGQTPVRPMSREELKSAIEGPARVAGLRLEEGLTRRLLLDLESAEGPGRDADTALPLLAFALRETWKKSDKRVLTLSDYEATGGIWGAVTQQAEEVYENLGPTQDAAKLLLLSMVQLGDGTDDIRRRVSVADLLTGRRAPEQAAIRSALDAYVAARLVTVNDGTAEIAHEALLRAWPRLREWIKEDRKELLDHQRLSEAARLWRSSGGPLYAGARLDDTRTWLDGEQRQARRGLSPLEQDFLQASVRAARRRRNRRLLFVSAAIVAALVLVAGGVYAVQQRAGNQQGQAVESSVALAQDADSLRATDPAGAMWLSLAAYNSSKTSQARTQLYKSLTVPYPLTLPGRGKGAADGVAYSPDGATAAAAWRDGTVRAWRVSDPLRPVLVATFKVRAGAIDRLAFSPDGTILAIHALGSLELWKVDDGSGRPVLLSDTRVTAVSPPMKGTWLPVAFSPNGQVVATGDGDGRLRLWNVSDPAHPVLMASFAVSSRPLTAVAFSPDGDALAVASENSANSGQGGRVGLWDVRNPGKPVLRSALTVSSPLSVAFSSVGHLLAVVGSNEHAYVWHVADIRKPVSVQVDNNVGVSTPLASVAFRPHSDVFVTADPSGETEIWSSGTEYSSGDKISYVKAGYLPDPAGPDSVAFSPSGSQILTGDSAGSVESWSAPTPLLTGPVYIDASGGSPWNGNGTLLITDNNSIDGGAVELWDVSDPFHPVREALFPGKWAEGYFLPGNDTAVTTTADGNVMRLWNVSDPRHPRAGDKLPDLGYGSDLITSTSWAGSGNGLLLIANTDDVRLWDVRNISHPVLDATLNATSQGLVTFLSNRLAAVVTKNGMELWDIGNPQHPVAGGVVPAGAIADLGLIYVPSRHLLATNNVKGTASGTTLWSLEDLRKPGALASGADMDPTSIAGLNKDTWAALTVSGDTIGVWNASNPRRLTRIAALPLGSSSVTSVSGLSAAASSGGWLAATGVQLSSGDDEVYISEVPSDGRAISNYAQLSGDIPNYEISPDGKLLATNIHTDLNNESALEAFDPLDAGTTNPGIVYPLNSDSLYQHLCSIALQAPFNPSWRQYLPDTYYRPACS